MFEMDSPTFLVAVVFITTMLGLVVTMYTVYFLTSSKRLRRIKSLADSAITFSPAFMTIIFDKRDRVIDLRAHEAEAEFRKVWHGKKKDELDFLPGYFMQGNGAVHSAGEQEQATTPLKMPDDSVIYLRWEMQDHTKPSGKTEFRLARGYNRTEELLQTQNMLKRLSATASEREERERKRIADTLHDRLGEVIITSKRIVADLKKKHPSVEFQQSLEELENTIKDFSRGTHSVIYDLIPPALYNVGLAAAIEAYANKFAQQEQLDIQIHDMLGDFHLNQDLALFLYKAALEFLHNAVKHGGADQIVVTLARKDGTLALIVEDNGAGFNAEAEIAAPNLESGFGLFSIKNRAEYYHGDLERDNSLALGGGKITVWVKCEEATEGWKE